jgi:hypothetical protein
VVKASKLKEDVVETFKAKCDELESQGEEPNRSLEGLLKFAKQVENGAQGGGQDEQGEGEGSGAEVETRAQVIFTLTYKTEAGNVAVKISDRGEIKTTNSVDEIQNAINFLQSIINN